MALPTDAERGSPELEALLAQRDFVRGLARRLIADEHGAEDLAQSALAVALRAGAHAPEGTCAWLAGISRRLASRERRSAARRAAREERAAVRERSPSAAAVVAREEWRRHVVAAVLELEPRQREVVLLRFFEGLPPRRIARVLGLPVETVKTRLKRGLASLRPRLEAGREREDLFAGLALLAAPPGAAPLLPAFGIGAIVMSNASKLALVALAVLGAGLVFFAVSEGPEPPAADERAVRSEDQRAASALLDARDPQEDVRAELGPAARASPADASQPDARPALVGRVVGAEDDRPIAGVEVTLELAGRATPERLRSGSDGSFELALAEPARLVAARVGAGERSAAQTEVLALELEPGGARELTLHVTRGMRVLGRVLDLEGNPVAGAQALGWCARESTGEPERRTRADGEGRFALEHLGADFRVEARAEGWLPANAIVGQSGALAESEELVLRLARPAALRVRVRDEAGAPIEGAEVRVAMGGPDRSTKLTRSEYVYFAAPAATSRSGLTDARGELVFERLATTAQRVEVRCSGFVPETLFAHPGAEPLEVVLRRGACIHGMVLAADGGPAVGASVRLVARETLGEARTDEAGRFAIAGADLSSVSAWLAVRATGHAAFVHEPVRAADCPLLLRLEPARALAGVLRGLDGAPATGLEIRVEGERLVRGDVTRALDVFPTWESLVLGLTRTHTDAAGRFRCDGLYDGHFELAVVFEHEGVERRQAWRLRSGDEDLELVLDPARCEDLVFEGRVRDALTGEPVRDFTLVVLAQKEGAEGNAGTFNSAPRQFRSEDGRFRLGGLAPMRASLFVRAPGYRDQGIPPLPRAPGRHEIDVELSPIRSVALRVVDSSGAPLVGASLMVFDAEGQPIWLAVGSSGFSASIPTDAAGEAILQNLPAGRIRIDVHLPADLSERLP